MARVPNHAAIARHFAVPPEWRMNPVTGEWVIIAPERSARPMMQETHGAPPTSHEPCPFCAGHEWNTPPELKAYRTADSSANGPGWRVRALPNRFAAVKPGVDASPSSDGFYHRANGIGRHELFVECPHHETNLAHLSVEQIREVVQMWRERFDDASRDPALRYAQLFKNHGGDAGASVEHSHSQMIATPMIPITIQDELRFALNYHEEHGACCYCELVHREKVEGSRAVAHLPGFAAFTAYASRQPFETWIVPLVHGSRFERITPAEADRLGTVLWTILRKLDSALDGPAYNLVFHSAPFQEEALPYYHWHLEVLPRMTQLAGYEWGTGSHLNPVLPEDAALVLRETEVTGT